MQFDSALKSVVDVSDMAASLMATGYAPAVLIGAKVVEPDSIEFAVTVLPGMDLGMLRELLRELHEQAAAGTFKLARIRIEDPN